MHPYIPELKEMYRQGRIGRRAFVRNAALLGLSLTGIQVFLSGCQPETAAPTDAPAAGAGPTEAPAGATTAPTATPETAVKRGGTLRFDYAWLPHIDDPACDGTGTNRVGRNVAETLTWVDRDNVVHPLLLKSWEPSEDAKEWTFHLQEGVTFNNGKAFGTDDVIWNFGHWLDSKVGSPMADKLTFLSESGIEKVDDLTLILHLDRPFYGVPWLFHDYPSLIMPDGGCDDFYYGDAEHAIGTGPFLMEEFVPEERMVLVRREDYWKMGADGKLLPYVDRVEVTPGLDDASRLAAIAGDQIDLVFPSRQTAEELRGKDGIVVVTQQTSWNMPPRVQCDVKPFDDPRVRQAMKLCIDRERFRDLCEPEGTLGWDHWVSPLHEGYCPDTDKDRPQDYEQAKALLAEAGYPDGFDTEIVTGDWELRVMIAQVVKQMLEPAGINVTVKVEPETVFWNEWDQYPFSVTEWAERPLATDVLGLGCRCGAAWNEMHWCNEEFDSTLDQIEGTIDVDARRELLCKAQKLMQDDSGLILPFWNVRYIANQADVHGFTYSRNFLFSKMWLG